MSINLSKGQAVDLKKPGAPTGPFHATLRWTSAVDLDLHCFYRLADAPTKAKGFFGKIGQALSGAGAQEGQIYFGRKGNKAKAPWITLDKDAGVGDRGGANEENMHFWDIDKIQHALIVANIFAKKTNFAQYNGAVIVEGGGQQFEVPLTETKTGSWCVVARIDNSSGTPKLINVNETQGNKPELNQFI